MRTMNALLILAAAGTLGAQQSPRRPIAPATPVAPAAPVSGMLPATPMEPLTPMPAMTPMTPLAPLAPMPSMAIPAPETPWAPLAPMEPMTPMPAIAPTLLDFEMSPFFQGQGRVLSREEAARIAERAREVAREQAELQRELSRIQSEQSREQSRLQTQITREQQQRIAEIAREQARIQSEITREQSERFREQAREQAQQQAEIAREMARVEGQFAYTTVSPTVAHFPTPAVHVLPERAPAPWAQGDPADSMYRVAQQAMNSGDYRKAAQLFKEIPAKFKYSQYAVESMYWQAHSLYRVGSTPDLQEALQVLEALKAQYPSTRIRGSNADVGALQVRIAGVLSARGRGGDDIVKKVLAANTNTCDNEEVQIRAAALSALMQTDPAAAQDYAIKMLAKRDDCSRELRSSAVFLIGNKKDPAATRTLIDVAKNDPSQDVRSRAIEYLGRMPGDDALAALEDMLKTSDDDQVQRAAIRALANNTNPRARAGIKALVERNDVPEARRITALSSLRAEMATTEDVNWLQGLYGKTDSPRIRSSIINAMARLGGSANEKWFVTLANNESEAIDVRISAIRQAGAGMDVAALGRLYDQTGQRQLRMELVRQLGSRREPETIDKLGEIAKTGTDVEVRKRAIDALLNKKDERATKLLLGLLDRP